MLPIALQLYSVRDDMEKDFKGTLQKVKDMGYEGVEFAGLYGHSAAQVKEMLAEIGLEGVSAHVPYADMIKAPDEVLATYAKIGCQYVAVPYMTEEYRMNGAKAQEAVDGIRMLGETAKKLGMTLLYHNHDFEFEKVNGEYALDALYQAVPADLLQTEIDTCWVNVAGENPGEYLRKYTGRSPVVHLKDFVMQGSAEGAYELIGMESDADKEKDKGFEFRPLGRGMQDVPALLQAAEDAKSKWLVVEQDEPSRGKTPMECAQISIEYLKTI